MRDRLLLGALAEGWEGVFPKGLVPAVLLFLELPPEAVDVNVHPTKAEVRFREPHRVFPWVARVTREAWAEMKGNIASVLEPLPRSSEPFSEVDPQLVARSRVLWEALPQDRPYVLAEAATAVAESAATPLPPGVLLKYLGTFQDTYLLAEVQGASGPELWIVDQHVAHERILYERLFLRRHAPALQPLLPAAVVSLGPAQTARLEPFLDEMKQVGFDIEPFGGDALIVRGLPDFLADRDPGALLEALLHRLESGGRPQLDDFRRELNAELACRAAVKKHQRLPPELAERLIGDLMACQVPHTCPHGRPVIKKLSLADLARSFGR